jgi:hypothetical protein
MNEAYWAEVGDLLRSFFLWNESNVSGVEPMKVIGAQARKLVDHRHDIILYCAPTRFKKSPRKAIRARGFITSGPIHRGFDFLFCELSTEE